MLNQFIRLDPKDTRTLQEQIKGEISKAIFAGFVPKNMSITSSRKLAKQLNVSRNTVLRAYELLTEEGVLVTLERKGYYVNPQLEFSAPVPLSSPKPMPRLNWEHYLNKQYTVSGSVGKKLHDYPYLFVHGVVDEDLFPVSEWRK